MRAFFAVFGLAALCAAGELAETPELPGHSAPSVVPAVAPSAVVPAVNLSVAPLTSTVPDGVYPGTLLALGGQPNAAAQPARADRAGAGLADAARAAFARSAVIPELSLQAAVAIPSAEGALAAATPFQAAVSDARQPQGGYRALPFAAELARRFGAAVDPGTLAAGAALPAAVAAAALSPAAAHGAYAAGNGLAFAFTPPQVYQTLRDGHARAVPWDRVTLAAASSALLGLVNAPQLGKTLWGVQNLFTALMFLAPALIGALVERRRGRGFGRGAALGLTAAATAASLLLAAGLYAAAATLMPVVLSALLGSQLPSAAAGVLFVTGAVYAGLFIPDTISTVRGRPPKGFTSLVALIYFLDSALFLAWSSTSLRHPGPDRGQYLILAAFNVIGTAGAFLSWYFTRRRERAAIAAARRAPRDPSAAAR